MTVAFDLASFPLFRDGDFYYPGVASLLSIINCGGRAIIFHSKGEISRHERKLIDELTTAFGGKILFAPNGDGADMSIN